MTKNEVLQRWQQMSLSDEGTTWSKAIRQKV